MWKWGRAWGAKGKKDLDPIQEGSRLSFGGKFTSYGRQIVPKLISASHLCQFHQHHSSYHHPTSPHLFFSSLRASVSVTWIYHSPYIFFLKSYNPSIYGGLWDLYCHIAGFFALCCRRTQHLTSKLPWNVCDKSSVSVLSTRLEVFPRVCPI